jgi:phosphoenolpyruvate carboxykinase (GTP)
MENFLREKLEQKEYEKLIRLENKKIIAFVAEAIELCRPESVFVCTDTREDRDYIRQYTIEAGEETKLAIEGHTSHFDGFFDQARDKSKTKFLLPRGKELGANFNCLEKEEGVREIKDILKDSMVKAKMIVRFFSLGPIGSPFSILCLQITDSGYVAHAEDILYRPAYEEFKREGEGAYFFRFLHSAGELEGNVSKNI